jgi:xanthine dehydrogenase/oxidase
MIGSVLGVPAHKIVSKTKRLGGGFGGKETRGIFLHCAIAVPAYHLKRPVRIMLDRDEDMQITGGLFALGLRKIISTPCLSI